MGSAGSSLPFRGGRGGWHEIRPAQRLLRQLCAAVTACVTVYGGCGLPAPTRTQTGAEFVCGGLEPLRIFLLSRRLSMLV